MTIPVSHHTEALTDLVLGQLPEAEAREVEAHLAGCAQCCQELADISATVDRLVTNIPPEHFITERGDPDDPFIEGVLHQVREAKGTPRRRPRGPAAWLAAAAAVVVLVGGGIAVGRFTAPQSPVVQAAGGQTLQGVGVGGASLRATLTPSPSGQWMRLIATASGFPAGECRLVLVTTAGQRVIGATWMVPAAGEPAGGVEIAGTAAVPAGQVRAVAVDDGNGRELVFLPLPV